jgi:hypothetical protein
MVINMSTAANIILVINTIMLKTIVTVIMVRYGLSLFVFVAPSPTSRVLETSHNHFSTVL